tara:strand:- start:162 stop:431 length:270 start_codon:yes stop_codon:yes gene_type:complete
MCIGGGRRQSSPPPAPQVVPAPPLIPPPPVRDIPKPEEIRKATEDPDLITGKKKTRRKLEMIKKGVKQFDAIDPGMNPGTPDQGIPPIK